MNLRTMLLLFVCCVFAGAQVASDYRVGVYYFPGWKATASEDPWSKIRPYPEREPMLGWYKEGDVSIAESQIEWMHQFGINFVMHDWYWSAAGKAEFDHALNSYLKAKNGNLLKFGIIWCNHTKLVPSSLVNFDAMIDHWIKTLFCQSTYLKQDGKPVVIIFSPVELHDIAKRFATTSKDLLTKARLKAKMAGYPGIYFIGVTAARKNYINNLLVENGYDATTGYNYSKGYSGEMQNDNPLPSTFEGLSNGYRENWDWILKNGSLPYWVPVTPGWNKRPWGSSTPHDNCVSTPDSFAQHLRLAKMRLDQFPQKTQRTLIICAWNEFGEGSYIEPTRVAGKAYLEAIWNVIRKE